MAPYTPYTDRVIRCIRTIPEGRVMSYGTVAAVCGNPRGARQVSRILHSLSSKQKLPWHRVVNSAGKISLPRGDGYEIQLERLMSEGIVFVRKNSTPYIPSRYFWLPDPVSPQD